MLKQAIEPGMVAKRFLAMMEQKATPKTAYQFGRLTGILNRRKASKPEFYTSFFDTVAPYHAQFAPHANKINEHPLLRDRMFAGRRSVIKAALGGPS